ncbi:MAG: hypothetical protein JWM11_3789 [Planctomycetaceae bacterium]|nr:hypothetical protein [Planctomycetaceae bacterium]
MNHLGQLPLLAKMDLPVGKGIAMIAFFGSVALFSTYAMCLPNASLSKHSEFIGTTNPHVARGICVLTAIVGWLAVCATTAALAGFLD